MNTIQQGIITLLKSAVLQQPLSLPAEFNMELALPVIRSHGILPLAYDGAARCGISSQTSIMQQMFAPYCKAIMVSEGQRKEIARIREAFDRNAIDYMLLKGSRMKDLYPMPELRQMGDADILIKTEQYEQIRLLMESLGFVEERETDHELAWRSKRLYLELHKRLIPSYNKDFYAYYGDGWKLAKYCNGTSYSMSAEDEWIYLFTHFAKHYRDGGIGLRHVLDLWIWRRTHPDMDDKYILQIVKKLYLDAFYENIRRLLQMWFEDGQGDDVLDVITEYIFNSGKFGSLEAQVLSQAVRNRKDPILGYSGRLQYVKRMAFPGVDVLKEKYTVLQKAPWLLPGVWMIRPFYKILYERESLKTKAQCVDVLSRQNMDAREAMLSYVGLDYHFGS